MPREDNLWRRHVPAVAEARPPTVDESELRFDETAPTATPVPADAATRWVHVRDARYATPWWHALRYRAPPDPPASFTRKCRAFVAFLLAFVAWCCFVPDATTIAAATAAFAAAAAAALPSP